MADAAGSLALVSVQGGLFVVRLEGGELLAHVARDRVPLLVYAAGAVVLDPEAACVESFSIPHGQPRWTSAPLPWPDWARQPARRFDAAQVQAARRGDSLLLRWDLAAHYGGGAPPPPELAKPPATGLCALDLASGKASRLKKWPPAPQAADWEPSADPAVIAQSRIGSRLYAVVAQQRDAGLHILLRAADAGSGRVEWETALASAPERGPPALRP